jgi:hypothetical protein
VLEAGRRGCSAGSITRPRRRGRRRSAGGSRWRTEPPFDGLDGILNRYGTQGWELVGILDDERRGVSAATAETVLIGITLVLKRPA